MLSTQKLFRICLIIGLLIAFSGEQPSLASSDLHVRFVATEPCALVYFIEKLAGNDYSSRCLRRWLSGHHRLTARGRQIISCYRSLLQRNYEFSGELKQRRTLPEELEYLAAHSYTVNNYLERVRLRLNPANFAVLQLCVHYFQPIFESLLWQPNKDKIRKFVEDLEHSSSRTALNQHIQQIEFLYGGDWPRVIDLVVAIVILPKQQDLSLGRDAHCNGSLEVIEITPDQAPSEKWGTIFHELTHSIWMTIPADTHKTFYKHFRTAGGLAPYKRLPEAIATALGTGWFMSQVNDGVVDKFWYSDPIIRGYAQSLLPLLERYLTDHRTLDKEFAFKATELFTSKFPDRR